MGEAGRRHNMNEEERSTERAAAKDTYSIEKTFLTSFYFQLRETVMGHFSRANFNSGQTTAH